MGLQKTGIVFYLGHFSIAGFTGKHPTLSDLIFKSTLADILVALSGFLIAKAIYDSYFKRRLICINLKL